MTQYHTQIKLTPKPINLDDVYSFVAQKGLYTCSNSSASNKDKTAPISLKVIEAQATVAKMEIDAIVFDIFEEFDLCGIAVHYRLGNCAPNEITIAFAVSADSKIDAESACHSIAERLNGLSESWEEEEFTGEKIWIKSN